MSSNYRKADRCLEWNDSPRDGKNPLYSKKTRFLLITLGATGSGKSSMAKELKKYAKKINAPGYRAEWEEKVLDDYVEETQLYKEKMDTIIDELKTNLGPDMLDLIDNLDGCNIYSEPWNSFVSE